MTQGDVCVCLQGWCTPCQPSARPWGSSWEPASSRSLWTRGVPRLTSRTPTRPGWGHGGWGSYCVGYSPSSPAYPCCSSPDTCRLSRKWTLKTDQSWWPLWHHSKVRHGVLKFTWGGWFHNFSRSRVSYLLRPLHCSLPPILGIVILSDPKVLQKSLYMMSNMKYEI